MRAVAGHPGLVERERELDRLRLVLRDAGAGRGGVAMLEAPAGHGKTALLHAMRREAGAAGFLVLAARGAALERSFGYGLVRQLLEGEVRAAGQERRERLFAGAARLAEPVFGASGDEAAASDPSHARLHGLYWLIANLAGEQPVLLLVDDAHWGDSASLRALGMLARRLDDLPVALAVAARPAEPDAEQDLLEGLSTAPAAVVVRPRTLSSGAVRALVEGTLEASVDEAFASACFETTRGNPLLVCELARTLAREGVRGRADEATAARRAVPGTIARTVVSRLRRLSPDALAVARALAVLGDRASTATVAELAGVPAGRARAAQATLARVGLIDPERLAFSHPMVQEAVHADLAGGERSRWHRRAARLLAAGGAAEAEVALHLLVTDPEDDPWTARVLAAAGRRALADGAPDAAERHLARALAEGPDPGDLAAVELALGMAEAALGRPTALGHLDAAVALGDPVTAAHAARARSARLIICGRADEAAASLRDPLAAVARVDPGLADEVEDDLLDALAYVEADLPEYRERVAAAAARARPAGLAHLCWLRATAGAPATEVTALARRALASGRLAGGPAGARFTPFYVIEALHSVEDADGAAGALGACRDAAVRAGSRVGLLSLAFMQPQWDRLFGDLRRAEDDARAALEEFEAVGGGAGAVAMRAVLTAVLVERASLAEADAVAEELPPAEGPQHAMIGLHATRARLRQEQGRHAEALVELDAQLTVERRRGCVVPTREHVRAMRVETLAALGRTEEATRLADEEVALARRRGVAGAEARARLARSHVLPARAARAELERAVALARRSPSSLLRARCLASLGSVLLRAGAGAEAREPLGEARDLAHRCGATGLEGRVHEELLDAGARPRRVARSGPAALTASERRVAELAAQEIPNREIAERLCVTPKTVEVHLGRVYGKLGIKGRTQLAGALTGAC